MANVGLKVFKFAPLTEADDGTATYGDMQTLAAAIESKMSLTTSDAELYADDVLNDRVDDFIKGALTLGIDNDDDAIFADLLNQATNTLSNGSVEYVQTTTDDPIYVGFSQIVPKRIKGKYKYKVEFLKKVKFKPYSTDKTTKGEKLEFTTPSVEGTVYPLGNGEWESHATFDTEAEALEYQKLCFGAESSLSRVEATEETA